MIGMLFLENQPDKSEELSKENYIRLSSEFNETCNISNSSWIWVYRDKNRIKFDKFERLRIMERWKDIVICYNIKDVIVSVVRDINLLLLEFGKDIIAYNYRTRTIVVKTSKKIIIRYSTRMNCYEVFLPENNEEFSKIYSCNKVLEILRLNWRYYVVDCGCIHLAESEIYVSTENTTEINDLLNELQQLKIDSRQTIGNAVKASLTEQEIKENKHEEK